MSRSQLLEAIADKAVQLRDLEKLLLTATDPRRVMEDLQRVRLDLDDLLLKRREQGQA